MKTPQIIFIIIQFLSLGISMEKHGKPKKAGVNNFWIDLIATVILTGILWWGGFFSGLLK